MVSERRSFGSAFLRPPRALTQLENYNLSRTYLMKSYELGSVIAQRDLEIGTSKDHIIRVLMGAPQRVDATEEACFVCPIQIIGIGDEKIRGAQGADAFRTIQLAMQLIGIELYVKLNPQCDKRIRWHGEADLGFPLPESVTEFGPQ